MERETPKNRPRKGQDPFEKFKEAYPATFKVGDDHVLHEEFLHERLRFAFDQGRQSAAQPAESIGMWTERMASATKMLDKLGEMSGVAKTVDINFAIEAALSLKKLANELYSEVKRLGVPATEEEIARHLDVYGNAFIFEGHLLNPARMVIKLVKERAGVTAPTNYEVVRRVKIGRPWPSKTLEEEAVDIIREFHDLYFEDGKPKLPPTDLAGIHRDGLAMIKILNRVHRLLEGEDLTEVPGMSGNDLGALMPDCKDYTYKEEE